MENLNNNANYKYVTEKVEFDEGKAKDITKEKIETIAKKYRGVISRILDDERLYKVELAEGYTCFGQTSRYARSLPEIGAITNWATQEKNGKTYEEWVKEFTENGIDFDGTNIPNFIDTKEAKEKAKKRAEERAKKEAEKKAKEEAKKSEAETK